MNKGIMIIAVNTASEAFALRDQGYEPIECSFGEEGSVVGSLTMDHHGKLSALEGVAIRAYRDHFGARREDPRFVVTGAADADATFAIAALVGELPHPSRAHEFEKAPPAVKAANTKDISSLAELVNKVDTAPIGVRLEETEDGCLLLLWNQLSGSGRDASAFHGGIDRWRSLTTRAPKALLAAAKSEEALRVAKAREAIITKVSQSVVCVESSVWGFDVWYADHAPVVVAFVATDGNVTIGIRDTQTAEKLLGPGGLKDVFGALQPKGWGGREAIGGSPRGQKLSRKEALDAAKVIAGMIDQHQLAMTGAAALDELDQKFARKGAE